MNTADRNYRTNDLETVRRYLRNLQRTGVAEDSEPEVDEKGISTKSIVESLYREYECTPTDDPEIVRRGVFRFHPVKEAERIRLAEDLIRRTDPGPLEIPQFLTLLSYQAASVESYLSGIFGADVRERLSTILLGTLQKPEVNATAHLSKRGYTIIAVNTGLVDLIIESAKAVIEASNPTRPADGRSATAHTSDLDEIVDGLRRNTEPIERVWKTLEACFFEGYPRSTRNETIEEDHGPPFIMLVSMALRWVIAHEYGHSLELDFSNITGKSGNHGEILRPGAHNAEWAKEFFADTQVACCADVSMGRVVLYFLYHLRQLTGCDPVNSLSFFIHYLDDIKQISFME